MCFTLMALPFSHASSEGLPNRMASISKVVAVCPWWSLFRVVVRLGADFGQQDCKLSWPIMFCGRRLAPLIFGGNRRTVGRRSAVGRRKVSGRTADGRRTDGGRRTAVGGAHRCSAAGALRR